MFSVYAQFFGGLVILAGIAILFYWGKDWNESSGGIGGLLYAVFGLVIATPVMLVGGAIIATGRGIGRRGPGDDPYPEAGQLWRAAMAGSFVLTAIAVMVALLVVALALNHELSSIVMFLALAALPAGALVSVIQGLMGRVKLEVPDVPWPFPWRTERRWLWTGLSAVPGVVILFDVHYSFVIPVSVAVFGGAIGVAVHGLALLTYEGARRPG